MDMPRAPRVRKMLSFRSDACFPYRPHDHEDICHYLLEFHPSVLDVELTILIVYILPKQIEAINLRVICFFFKNVIVYYFSLYIWSHVLHKREIWSYKAPFYGRIQEREGPIFCFIITLPLIYKRLIPWLKPMTSHSHSNTSSCWAKAPLSGERPFFQGFPSQRICPFTHYQVHKMIPSTIVLPIHLSNSLLTN